MRIVWAMSLAVGLSLTGAGIGQAKVLDCAFSIASGNLGWLSDRYIFDYDDKAGTVLVLDGLIQQSVGKPIAGKPKVVSAKQTAFTWTVLSKNTVGTYVKMVMRATFFKADNSMIIAGKPAGFLESFDQRGTCKVQ